MLAEWVPFSEKLAAGIDVRMESGWTNVAFANLILNSVAHPQQISGIVQLQPRE